MLNAAAASLKRSGQGRPWLQLVRRAGIPLAFFAAVFGFRLLYVSFHDDHFDRISRGRQILAFGEAPFRDFFDPGYFLMLYSSAAVQALFGHNLLGEALLSIACIAAGFTLALGMARRMSGSWAIALAAAVAGVLTLPRLYNYDNVLFFPLALLLCWRYIDKPTLGRLAAVAAATAVAALYRYDSGVYLACTAAVAVAAAHGGDVSRIASRVVAYAAMVLAALSPAVVFVHATAGVPEAARQVADYALREGRRTAILSVPKFNVDLSAPPLIVGPPVSVRWSPEVTHADREQLEETYSLRNAVFAGGRTWRYRLRDRSHENLDALIGDPAVEDTHGLDRSEGGPRRPPPRTLAVLPGVFTVPNAAAWLGLTLMALPVVALACSLGRESREMRPLLLVAAALCLSAGAALLRAPLAARIGDVAAPAVPVAAWLVAWLVRPRTFPSPATRAGQALVGAVLALGCLAVGVFASPAVSATVDWEEVRRLGEAPPSTMLLPAGDTLGLVEYVRACTRPGDRLLATWFAPEVYYFSGRGFAGGMIVFFGGHWSATADQRAIVARLQTESVPIVVSEVRSYPRFQSDYPLVDAYLQSAYDVAAQTPLGNPQGEYRILTGKDAAPAGASPRDGLPCFR